MKRLILVALYPTPEQALTLALHHQRWLQAVNFIAAAAHAYHTASKVRLQKLTYRHVRTAIGLPAHLTITAISVAAERYKRAKPAPPTPLTSEAPVTHTRKTLSWRGPDHISLLTPAGRLTIPFSFIHYTTHDEAPHPPERIPGVAWLFLKNGRWLLLAATDSTPAAAADDDQQGENP